MLPSHRALAFASLVAALAAQEALADPMKLICQNPRREYLVVFEPGAKTLTLNPDTENVHYAVKSVKKSEDGLVVRGNTMNGGPDFELFFGDGAAMVYKTGGDGQIDYCRHV